MISVLIMTIHLPALVASHCQHRTAQVVRAVATLDRSAILCRGTPGQPGADKAPSLVDDRHRVIEAPRSDIS
ncbi:hypothetical protein [Streptomyces sp. NRRL B-1347]|uniref:hypothetical protein n=1 Tax=Streptomyces sp. NRRL B-1347 TaxID=1476877 RepID=UPI00131BB840|nr:hypothetical protein [Streptomyces sp. NRRL B-1347]